MADNPTNTENTNQSNGTEKRKYSVQDIPRLPREVTPFATFYQFPELDQRGPFFKGPGAKYNSGRYRIRSSDEENVKRAKKFAMEQSVKHVLVKQQQQQQRQQMDVLKKQQALLLMCRIYIGSINFELNEANIKQEFLAFGPVKAVSLTIDPVTNHHKGFAFVEFETPEAAQLAMEQMNGAILGGRNIKVGRPSNMPQAQPIIDQLTEEAKNYNRIYIASVHPAVSETDIHSVFEAFGKVVSCTLAKDSMTNKHKGYGFIEFDTNQAAHEAISSMNLFDLGGQRLRVGKALTPPEGLFTTAQPVANSMPTATALAVATITAQLQAKEAETKPTVTTSQTMNNPLADVNVINGPMAPTAVAAVFSAASLSRGTAVTSMISNVINPTSVAPNPTPQPTTVNPSGIRPSSSVPVPQPSIPQPSILEEPPIPVGLNPELSSTQQYPSVSLVLPTKPEPTDNQKPVPTSDDILSTLSQQEGLSIKGREQRHLLSQKLSQRRLESRVCMIRNMAKVGDIDDDIEQEVTEECSKFGDIIKVLFYTEQPDEDTNAEPIVKIFVEFTTSEQAEKAVGALHGRRFDGRKIQAELYDQLAYQADDLTG